MPALTARPKAKRKLTPEAAAELPQQRLPVLAQADSQPLPEAEAPAKRVKPEPQDEYSPSGHPQPVPAPKVDCLGASD